METLKTGMLAYYDTFAGLIPCKVTKVFKDSGDCGTVVKAEFILTSDRQAYKKGEVLTDLAFHVIPRKAIRKTRYSSLIMPYEYELDATI
jgi:hypothetical protein